MEEFIKYLFIFIFVDMFVYLSTLFFYDEFEINTVDKKLFFGLSYIGVSLLLIPVFYFMKLDTILLLSCIWIPVLAPSLAYLEYKTFIYFKIPKEGI